MDPPDWVRAARQQWDQGNARSIPVISPSDPLSSSNSSGTTDSMPIAISSGHSRATDPSQPNSFGSWSSRRGTDFSSGSRPSSSRLSSSLSRRNSTVWLASMSMDVNRMTHSRSVTRSQSVYSFQTLTENEPTNQFKSPRLDTLPMELITLILQFIAISENGPQNLYKVLSVCGRFYDVGVATLYRHVIFRYPHTFDKFRWSIESTGYGQHVRVLDFSAFTSIGLGRSRRMNMEIQMVSDQSIYRVLELCPGINEFLGGEAIDIDLSTFVVDKLLSMPVLNTIDFCGANETTFVSAIATSLFMNPDFTLWNLTKLSLHCCNTLPAHCLKAIMSKLVSAQRLDLTHTSLTEDGLLAVPESAKLTHLSLSRCVKLSSHSLVKFLVLHPATKKLKWLNLMFEATKPNPLTPHDFDTIVKFLPQSITHLNLNGLPVTEKHLYLLNYTKIRSLGIAHSDITLAALRRFLPLCTDLKYIDLTGMACITKWVIQDPEFMNCNRSIEMFEVSQDVLEGLKGVNIPGWVVNPGRGRRGWIHRVHAQKQPQQEAAPTKQPFSFAQLAKERLEKQRAGNVPQKRTEAPGPPPAWDPIWRHASHKVNVSEIGIGGVPTPAIFGQEGLYNYYSLHSN